MVWEYQVKQVNLADRWNPKAQAQELATLQEHLNILGAEGWEMVSYESIPLAGAFSGKIKGYAYLMFFKRESAP
jgi:hypothetical protein